MIKTTRGKRKAEEPKEEGLETPVKKVKATRGAKKVESPVEAEKPAEAEKPTRGGRRKAPEPKEETPAKGTERDREGAPWPKGVDTMSI